MWGIRTNWFLSLVLLCFAIIFSLPTLSLLITSFRPLRAIATEGWWTLFSGNWDLTLDHYRTVIFSTGIGRAFLNSLWITGPATVLNLLLGAMAAYGLSCFRFSGKDWVWVAILSLQVLPLQMTLIPVTKILETLGLGGRFPGIWLVHAAFGLPFTVFLFGNFFRGLPRAFLEAAHVDGASSWQIFWKIVMPLSKPVTGTLLVFQFLWIWNDLLVGLVVLGGQPGVAPLTVKISSMLGSLEAGWHLLSAAAFISMLLPLILFIFFQKHLAEGVSSGALKG